MYNPTDNDISLTVYNMHLYYDHTVYSFPLYTHLWPEDGPQWPKHVVVSIINRVQRQVCFDVPHPLPNPDDIVDNHVVGIPGREYQLIRGWRVRHSTGSIGIRRSLDHNLTCRMLCAEYI